MGGARDTGGKTSDGIALHGARGIVGYAIVDDDWIGELSAYRWNVNSNGYAVRAVREAGRSRALLMHRVILGLTFGDGLQGDHINRVKLDNRRTNLRIVTQAGNNENKPSHQHAVSRYRAVFRDIGRKKPWRARPCVDGHYHHLGYFGTELEAALAVERFRARTTPHLIRDPELSPHEQTPHRL